MSAIFLSLLVGCGWADPPDPDAERLHHAECASPINSGLPPEEPSALSSWFRLGSLHRWLLSHPDARSQIDALDDYLRAHPDAKAEGAWTTISGDLETKPPLTVQVKDTPYRLIIVVDRSYSTAPGRSESVNGVATALEAVKIPMIRVGDRGTTTVQIQRENVNVGSVSMSEVPEPTGWLVVQEGKAPVWVSQDIASTALGDIGDALGVALQ